VVVKHLNAWCGLLAAHFRCIGHRQTSVVAPPNAPLATLETRMTHPSDILNRLTGCWIGSGLGSYPGIEPFRYTERLLISHEADWNMLHVLQRTWLEKDGSAGRALHLESGIVHARDDGTLVYSCGQDNGRTEVMVGTITLEGGGMRIDWVTTEHANDSRLLRMGRTWMIDGASLRYEAHLSTVRTPEYRKHLEANLQRSAAVVA
jgi:hypothetical protein